MKPAAIVTIIAAPLIAITGCAGPAVSSTAATFTVKALLRDQTLPMSQGAICDGPNVFNLQKGTQVKIEAKGNTVAMGTLDHGVMEAVQANGYFCDFQLSVANVPTGLGFYTIDLGERNGHKEFSEQDLKNGVSVETSTFDGQKYS